MSAAPDCPTAEQCSAKERVAIPGSDVRAHAVWWPQMGGYSGKAVITITDCATVWLWHDSRFPIKDDQPPREIHLCDPRQWIDVFQWLHDEVDAEINDGPEPYRLDLPPGVTREEAEEVYAKIIKWGMWEPDPGGIVIRTHEEQIKPCTPVACPPFTDTRLDVTELYDWRGGVWHTPLGSETVRALKELSDIERAAMTAEQRLALDVAEKTLIHGNAYVELIDRMIPLVVEVNPDSAAGRAARAARAGVLDSVSLGFTPNVEQVLAMRLRPRYGYEETLTTPAGVSLSQWGDYPYGVADSPLIVGVPEGYDPVAVSSAVALCQSLGLLPDTPHGMLFMPEGAETDLPD